MSQDEYVFEDDDDEMDDDDNYMGLYEPNKQDQAIRILEEDQLLSEQDQVVRRVSDLLHVTPSAACLVLRHFRWNYDDLSQRYFENPEKLRSTLGISLGKVKPYKTASGTKQVQCGICFDNFAPKSVYSLPCNHYFCHDCWREYLTGKLEDGPSCTTTHCPHPKCPQAVDETLFQELLSERNFDRYRTFVTRTFVEDNPHIAWCPGKGCTRAVVCEDTKRLLVRCFCGHRFCFVCKEAAHPPAKCDEVRAWFVKEKGESENSKWIFVHTKTCSKCNSPIEKNDGCNHMTCSRCRHEFCWICLGDWKTHGTSYNKCNQLDKAKLDSVEKAKGETRKELERYLFYYERFAVHQKSQQFNEKDLLRATEKATQIKKEREQDAQYIVEAVEQIVENRELLKFTYVYAYFLDPKQKGLELFLFNQQALEKTTEDLNGLINRVLNETDLSVVMHSDDMCRQKITDLVGLNRDQLHKLLQGVYDEEEEKACSLISTISNKKPVFSKPTSFSASGGSFGSSSGSRTTAVARRLGGSASAASGSRSQRNVVESEPPSQRPKLATQPLPTPSAEPIAKPVAPALSNARDTQLAELTAMGFDHDQAVAALDTCDGSVEQAMELLLAMTGD